MQVVYVKPWVDPERTSLVAILIIAAAAGLCWLLWHGYKQGWYLGRGELLGKVTDSYHAGFQYALVMVKCVDHDTGFATYPDAGGNFRFGELHSGKWELRMYTWVGEYRDARQTFAVRRNHRERLSIEVDQKVIGDMKTQVYADWRQATKSFSTSFGGGGGG